MTLTARFYFNSNFNIDSNVTWPRNDRFVLVRCATGGRLVVALDALYFGTSCQEEECVENLFDALAAALLVPDNQSRFRYGKPTLRQGEPVVSKRYGQAYCKGEPRQATLDRYARVTRTMPRCFGFCLVTSFSRGASGFSCFFLRSASAAASQAYDKPVLW